MHEFVDKRFVGEGRAVNDVVVSELMQTRITRLASAVFRNDKIFDFTHNIFFLIEN